MKQTCTVLVLTIICLTMAAFAAGEYNPDYDAARDVRIAVVQKPASKLLHVGEKLPLLDRGAASSEKTTIRWITNNETVAVVNDSGIVKAVSPGNVRITARINNKKKQSVDLVVMDPDVVYEVLTDVAELNMHLGETRKIAVRQNPSTADTSFEWKVRNDDVVQVNPDTCEVTAVSTGKTVVIVRSTNNGIAMKIPVQVSSRADMYDSLRTEYLNTGKALFDVSSAVTNAKGNNVRAVKPKAVYKKAGMGAYACKCVSESEYEVSEASEQTDDTTLFRLLTSKACLGNTSLPKKFLKHIDKAQIFFEGSEVYACGKKKHVTMSEEFYLCDAFASLMKLALSQ